MKKKWLFIGLIFLAAAALIIGTWLYHKHQIKVAEEKLEKKIDQSVKQNPGIAFRKAHHKQGDVQITTYIPLTKDKQDNKLVKKQMDTYIKRDLKVLQSDKPRYYFYTFKEQSSAKNTDSFRIEKVSYERQGIKLVQLKKRELIQTLTLDQTTNDLLTLQSVFKNSFYKHAAFKKIVIEAAIRTGKLQVANGKDLATIQFPNKAGAYDFHLTNEALILPVKIPHVKTVKKVTIPLKTIGYQLKEKHLNKQYARPEVPLTSKKKTIALTFDDGPSSLYTPKILNVLRKHHAKATFFVLGSNVEKNPALVKREIAEGHQVGNHSWDHPLLTKRPAKEVAQQIWGTQIAVYQATGHFPAVVRPPYGGVDRQVAEVAGVPIVEWTVDTLDWKAKSGNSVTKAVLANAGQGEIVLMHDIHGKTAASLDKTLRILKKRGYRFVTVNELLGQELQSGCEYFSSYNHRTVK